MNNLDYSNSEIVLPMAELGLGLFDATRFKNIFP